MTDSLNDSQPDLAYSQWLSKATCEAIIQIAKDAGVAIMGAFERGQQGVAENTSVKEDNSPLTEADLAAHHVTVDGLTAQTPEIAVVSEEDSDSLVHRLPEGAFWLINPLDGTKEFIARNSEFTVNIALVVNGELVWGVVYAPALNQTYWDGSGLGACKQDGSTAPLSLAVGERSVLLKENPLQGTQAPIRVVASKSHLNESTEAYIKELGIVELVQAGSSLKCCKVADGGADIYPRRAPTCEWDTAAAQAIVEVLAVTSLTTKEIACNTVNRSC